MGTNPGEESGGRAGKVARLVDEYDFDCLGAEFERRWTANGDERASLRDLADAFNRRLLARHLSDAGVSTLAGEPTALYRLLTDDDVGAAERTQARRRLEREGVDVAVLRDEFVSYQAIRTYLTDDRGVEYEDATDAESDPVAAATDTIGRLRSRLASVTRTRLEAARRADAVDLDEYDVSVAVRVACRDCGREVAVETLLADGGCDCPH